jgi:hypothetical protein
VKNKIIPFSLALLLALLLGTGSAVAATTEIISVSSSGQPGPTSHQHAWTLSDISNDGRYVVFTSDARLTPDDVDPPRQPEDTYLRDRVAGTTVLLSSSDFNGARSYTTDSPAISGNGDYIALRATAFPALGVDGHIGDLLLIHRPSGTMEVAVQGVYSSSFAVDNQGNIYYLDEPDSTYYSPMRQIHKYDRLAHTSSLIYSSPGKINNWHPISVDDAGTSLSFDEDLSLQQSSSTAAYLLDIASGNRTLLSRTSSGTPATGVNGFNGYTRISSNGQFVIFYSRSADLEPAPYPMANWNLFVYDVAQDRLERLTFHHPQQGEFYPSEHLYNRGSVDISDNGRIIAVVLTDNSYSSGQYAAVLDRDSGNVEFLPDGVALPNMLFPIMTPDGRYIVSTGITPLAGGVHTLLYDLKDGELEFVVDAGSDQQLEQQTPYGAYASLTASLSGDSCADEEYRWSWAEGEAIGTNPILYLPSGTTSVTLDWSGCGGTASDTVEVTISDSTPPVLDPASLNGSLGNAGWYLSDVMAQLFASDSGSGVATIYAFLDNVETSISGGSGSIAITGDAIHSLSFYAVDQKGNTSGTTTMSIKIDTTAPTISGTALSQPNQYGWYNSAMEVEFAASDALSGLADHSPNQILTSEGANQSLTGSAVDLAGNRADFTLGDLNLDTSAPQISISGISDGATYNLGLVPTANFNLSDTLSGVATNGAELNGTPDIFGCGNFSYSVTATDQAGNSSSLTASYSVEATPEGAIELIDNLFTDGSLSGQTAGTVQASLERALEGYVGNPTLGDNMMDSFKNQVEAALNSGKVDAATAELLLDAASYILLNN